MAKKKHIHQYHRTYPSGLSGPLKGRGQWECALPDCSHYLPRNVSGPEGKVSICNGCMTTFVLDEENMKFDKPVCSTCSNPISGGAELSELEIERHMIRSTIANRTGRTLDEITDTEIDRQMQFNKLRGI
jgi:hypothetical protein